MSCSQDENRFDIKSSNEEIKNKVLLLTPLGSDWAKVMDYCKSENIRCETDALKGYRYEPDDYSKEKSKIVGVAHIKYHIGSYKNTPFTNLSKTIYWGFDNNKILIHVWVRQTIDAP